MPAFDRTTRTHKDITVDDALREIRRYREQYPDVAPEVTAMSFMRQVDSWDEYRAILKALDVVLAEIAEAQKEKSNQ